MKNKTIIIVLVLSLVTCCFALQSCNEQFEAAEYKDDIIVTVPDSDETLVIKEWTFLLSSGAEIYLQKDNRLILLGETDGADDGYCPFADGKYQIINNKDGTITVKWLFNIAEDTEIWHEKQFDIEN